MGHNRHNAVALHAADAKELLNSALPFVYKQMTADQIDQVQKVLDAVVVNPEIMKKANSSRPPFCRRSNGIASGSPSQNARPIPFSCTRTSVGCC